MATYSKETALYDTGAIGAGIAGAENNGKKEATNYIYAGSDGIKIANADPEHADTYQKQTAESTEFYVDGVKRNSVSGDGMKVYAGDGSTEMARFSNNAVIGTEDGYRTTIEEDSFSIKDADVNLFSVSPSGSPTTESFSTTYNPNDHADSEHPLNVTLPYTPVAGSTIKLKTIIARGGSQTGKDYILTAGTSRTITDGASFLPAWQIQYTSPKSFTFSFPDSTSTSPSAILEPYAIEYTATASDPVDLGIFSFGTRSSASSNGNNSATLGLDLQAMYNYQTVVGKHNGAFDGPFVVGNGGATASNALASDWDGNVKAKGNFYANCASDSSGTAHIGQVFDWQGNLKSNLTTNVDAYVESNGTITLPGGHTYAVFAHIAMTNSTTGATNRRLQIFNKTANVSIITESVFVAGSRWGTLSTVHMWYIKNDITLCFRGAADRPTTTIPDGWIRAVCIA